MHLPNVISQTFSYVISCDFADETMQCWGSWDEMGYMFIVLSLQGKPPQYVLVSFHGNAIIHGV